tara:strand:+ start:60 stop:899 length:840 start_codon:yes stop_codon:yes gene_type:complete
MINHKMENKMKTFRSNMFASVFATVCLTVLSVDTASADNEVLIDQIGDNLTLTVLQAGYGNSLSGDTSQSSDLTLTGTSLIIDLIQDGNMNETFGSWVFDGSGSSVIDLYFQGDSNIWDMNIGATGSGDYTDILSNIIGSSNIFDIDIGGNAVAESSNMDLYILGDRNDFSTSFTNTKVWADSSGGLGGNNGTTTQTLAGIVIDSSSNIWNFDITGDDNAFATKQASNDGNSMTIELMGSDGDFQLIQNMTSTCSPACAGVINLDIDSENASVSVVQQD